MTNSHSDHSLSLPEIRRELDRLVELRLERSLSPSELDRFTRLTHLEQGLLGNEYMPPPD